MPTPPTFAAELVHGFQAAFAPASEIASHDAALLVRLRLAGAAWAHAPSAVLYDEARQRLFLVEAVPAHGPITPARRQQLAAWAQSCPAHKVFVTAFADMATYQALGEDIAWETEVWLADAPQHLIHYGGSRFMGPR